MARVAILPTRTTAVDLSRLPAPTIVEQLSFETVRQEILDYLQSPEVFPEFDATVESDPAVKLIQVFAYRELLIRQRFNDRAKQVMLAYAEDTNLEHLGALVDVARLLIDPGDPELGIDPVYESDESLRERIQLAPESFSVAGPETAYVFHARSVAGTIRDASAISPAPGEVLVSILSRSGNGTASLAEIEAVEAKLATVGGNDVRPLTDSVTIASAAIVNYVIDARLEIYDGPDATLILAEARRRLDAWLLTQGRLGGLVARAAITAQLFVEGVANIDLVEPAADVDVDATQSAFCAGIDVQIADG